MKEKIYDSVSKEIIGNEITLIGTAANCKAGPCLEVKNTIIYLRGYDSWNDEYFNNKLLVTGTLVHKKLIPDPVIDKDGAISTGAYGLQWVLEKIVEIKKP